MSSAIVYTCALIDKIVVALHVGLGGPEKVAEMVLNLAVAP